LPSTTFDLLRKSSLFASFGMVQQNRNPSWDLLLESDGMVPAILPGDRQRQVIAWKPPAIV